MNKKYVIFLILIYIIFPLSSVFMKLASGADILPSKIIFFGMSIFSLFVFSILWQKIISKINLTTAYLFKSTTIIWNVIYGMLIFKEKILINEIVGILIVIVGLCVFLSLEESKKNV